MNKHNRSSKLFNFSPVRTACVYLTFIVLFFAALFYPEPSFFLNPEYGRSDISHINVPQRLLYDTSLQRGEMPLWTHDIGTGFPIFAETQIGSYFLMNLVLYGALPFWVAFNLGYVLTFFVGAFGMYLLTRKVTGDDLIAFGAGLMFSFSGFFMGHINHINMLQAASLLPWIVYAYLRAIDEGRLRWAWWAGLVLILSQQILAGHIQTVCISACLLGAYAFRDGMRKWALICSAYVTAALLSAVQILPSYELHSQSVRSEAFTVAQATFFSLHPRSLLTIINPNILGKIQDGTYMFLQNLGAHGNIYWETNLYMGVLAIIGLILSLRYLADTNIRKLWVIAIGSMLLMLGRYSPLYLVYSVFPFNLFSVPARFGLIYIWSVVLLTALTLGKMSSRIKYIAVVVTMLDIMLVWHGYGVLVPVSRYMKPPATAEYITRDRSIPQYEKSVLSLESGLWAKEFIDHGWSKGAGFIEYFNELTPNSNIIWGIPQHKEYVGRLWTQRKFVYDQHLQAILDQSDDSIKRELAEKLLNLASIDYIISATPLKKTPQLQPVLKHKPYNLYHNTTALQRFRMSAETRMVSSVEDIMEELLSERYTPSLTFVEHDLLRKSEQTKDLTYSIDVLIDAPRELELQVTSSRKALLIISDLYYPGWSASIDGKAVRYYPANMIQRAIVVPAGKHIVRMQYTPQVYIIGLWISGFAHLIVLVVAFLSWRKARQASFASVQ
jgi:Bacterial membrane protein YfhO